MINWLFIISRNKNVYATRKYDLNETLEKYIFGQNFVWDVKNKNKMQIYLSKNKCSPLKGVQYLSIDTFIFDFTYQHYN